MTVPPGTNKREKIIIELEREEIECIASLTHLMLLHHPQNSTLIQLLKHLVEQTDYVYSKPEAHGINLPLTPTMLTTQQRWGEMAKELDLSYLQQLIVVQDT